MAESGNSPASPPRRRVRALVDTNVVLDLLLAREPWYTAAHPFWRLRDAGQVTAFLSASTLTDIYNISRRIVGPERALYAVARCLAEFGVIAIHRAILDVALGLSGPDFEDNVQIACAQAARLDLIVTRNFMDFQHSPIPVVEPQDIARFVGP